MHLNKNKFFIALIYALIAFGAYYIGVEEKIYDVRSVYSLHKDFIPLLEENWNDNHFIEKDYKAYITPFFSSAFNRFGYHHIELRIRTNNKLKIDEIREKYITTQPQVVPLKEFYFIRTTIILVSKPLNTSVGIFILVFLVAWAFYWLQPYIKR